MAKKDIDNNDSNVSISQSELDKAFNNKKAASDAPADKKIAKKPSSTKEILPADQALPVKLLLIPLQGRPIFPGIFTPLMISSSDDTKVIEEVCSRGLLKKSIYPTAGSTYLFRRSSASAFEKRCTRRRRWRLQSITSTTKRTIRLK